MVPYFQQQQLRTLLDISLVGDLLPYSPKEKAYAAVQYSMPQPIFGGDLWARYDTSYQSKMARSLSDALIGRTDLLDGFTKSNMAAEIRFDGWELVLRVDNVWNEEAAGKVGSSSFYQILYPNEQRFRDSVIPSRPRTISLGFRMEFQ